MDAQIAPAAPTLEPVVITTSGPLQGVVEQGVSWFRGIGCAAGMILDVATPDPYGAVGGQAGLPVVVGLDGGVLGRPGAVLVAVEGGQARDVTGQIAALSWISQNAAAFGGDPADITVVGDNAGSLAALQASPLAKSLFRVALGV